MSGSGGQGGGGSAGQGNAGAPAQGAGAGQGGEGAPAATPDRMTLSEGLKTLSEGRRRQRAANGAANGANGAANGADGATPGTQAQGEPAKPPRAARAATPATPATPSPANGHAAPATEAGDPFAALIETFRKPAPPGAEQVARADPAQAPGSASVTLEVGGKPQSFTHAQLAEHVAKAADYTHKSQQLAAYAREVQQAQAAVAQVAPILIPMLEAQLAAMEGELGAEPDWEKLAATDPREYQQKHAKWMKAQAERAKLDLLQRTRTQEAEATRRQRMESGFRTLAQQIPQWADPATRGKLQTAVAEWGRAQGYSHDEINDILDPRHVAVMIKGMLFDRMMEGARTDAPVIPVVQRGNAPPPPAGNEVRQAEQAFEQRPTMKAGAALLGARRRAASNGRG